MKISLKSSAHAYEGYFNQNRLKRLVKEHKDYTSEFDEVTDLIERKKDLRIR
jgi:hypothetical protein